MPNGRERVEGCGILRYGSVRACPHRPWRAGPGVSESRIYVVYKAEHAQVFPEYVVSYQPACESDGVLCLS